MPEANHSFRDRLLELEPVTPELKDRYEKEIQAMFNKPLTGVRRWSWLVAAIGSAGLAVVFGAAALLAPNEFPVYARITFRDWRAIRDSLGCSWIARVQAGFD